MEKLYDRVEELESEIQKLNQSLNLSLVMRQENVSAQAQRGNALAIGLVDLIARVEKLEDRLQQQAIASSPDKPVFARPPVLKTPKEKPLSRVRCAYFERRLADCAGKLKVCTKCNSSYCKTHSGEDELFEEPLCFECQ